MSHPPTPDDRGRSRRLAPKNSGAIELGSAQLVDRIIYGTITLMAVLIVYDGWQHLVFIDVVAIIVGPVLAMFISHVFAANLAQQVARGRRLAREERLRIVRSACPFLLFAVPPVALLIVTNLAGVPLHGSIRVIIWTGAASLGFWGGVAGRRAGLRGWSPVVAVPSGLIIGVLVLALQAVLQPGKVFSGSEF